MPSLNYKSLLIALAAFLWATDTLLRQPLSLQLNATTIVLLEHLVALVVVVPLLIKYWPDIKKIKTSEWLGLMFVGIAASALATIAFTASFKYVSPSVSILLQKIQPLVTFLLAAWLLRENLPRRFWLYAVLALGGGYLISFPEIWPRLELYKNGALGVGLALVAAALWGSATVVGRGLLKRLPPPLLTALRFAVAMPFLMVLWLVSGTAATEAASLTWRQLLSIMIIMIGPGFGAMYIYYKGLAVTRAAVAALLELTWPLAAVILNWIFLHEVLSLVQIMGAVILLYAVTRLSLWPQQS